MCQDNWNVCSSQLLIVKRAEFNLFCFPFQVHVRMPVGRRWEVVTVMMLVRVPEIAAVTTMNSVVVSNRYSYYPDYA